MAKNYFERYIWLIDLINRHGFITYENISRAWAFCPLNSAGSASIQQSKLPQRTFFNHIDAIFDIFGIEIKCDRTKGYYIANSGDIEDDGIRQWLLESLALNNTLNETKDMRDRILFEKVPSSQRWLPVLVNAMRDRMAIVMTYQSYNRTEPSTFTAHPWCLKLFRQRWYVLAKSDNYTHPRIYSLDRIQEIKPSETRLRIPAKFKASEFFGNYFGIIIGDEVKPETVDVKVRADQVKYFESLPLHSSQTVVEATEDYTIFRYTLVPTFDFKQELLGRGPTVEALSPDWFRDEIREDIAEMASHYGMTTWSAENDGLPYLSEDDELNL